MLKDTLYLPAKTDRTFPNRIKCGQQHLDNVEVTRYNISTKRM